VDVGVEGVQPLLPATEVSIYCALQSCALKKGNNLLRKFGDVILHHLEGGIVEENIDSAHSLESFGDKLFAVLLARQVRCE
jgi:hypothetical protein